MKQFILSTALCVSMLLPGPAPAQEASEGAIQGVISDQFAAFIDRDVAQAWNFASPTIQLMFRTPENFGRMVENGYPMVWSPTDTTFLELRELDGELWQKVQVRDAAGKYHLLDYKMVETQDGWLIDAVKLIRAAGVGV